MSFCAFKKIGRSLLLLALVASIIGTQVWYDRQTLRRPRVELPPLSFQFIKTLNLGLNSATASFLWIQTIIHLPFLRRGYERFSHNLELINNLDPKFSFPYAFTVLVLPTVSSQKLPNKFEETARIGERGIREADPDWQIPFYLAVMYLVDLKDRGSATKYFDITARTPGVTPNIKSVSINFGTSPLLREEIKKIWTALYEDAPDEETRERAKNYVIRIEIIELLDAGIAAYKERHGKGPEQIEDLVRGGVLTKIPNDPYEYKFFIDEFGQAAVKPPALP